jgi:probable HAF family extracellular repeat protein
VLAHAFVSTGGSLQDLGTLGGAASWAYAVNDSAQIVGGFSSADNRSFAPFLYERGTMYDLNRLIVNPSAALPFAAYDINNFGEIATNHHVLYPLYEQVSPGAVLAFRSVLGQTFQFAYWTSRRDIASCDLSLSRLQLEVAFDVPGGTAAWVPADLVTTCADSTDWQAVSVATPPGSQGKDSAVRIRVNEVGPATHPSLSLRHFNMQ